MENRKKNSFKKSNLVAFLFGFIRCIIFAAIIIILSNWIEGARILDITDVLVIIIVSLLMVTISSICGKHGE